MKALIQRVHCAHVAVDGQIIGQIQSGVLAYIGIGKDDDFDKACKLVDKIITYRIFENTTDPDKLGKMDKSVSDVGGGLLLVSQFTLMAKTDKGRRPDFAPAMPPDDAKALFDKLVNYAKQVYPNVATGEFGANMAVMAVNDGPINFLLDV
ncbi:MULTISPECIES: D-aminoacyl-tRNA deacylase [Moraxella]|uniref:D-aminoacyl-tRNA deacylase n=1 Tax=Moraxella lacunata TaxID=477 RepID=A0A1B8Q2P1_MORLA|nr:MULTISPECIES: D-aminoacyl-tRNA deacylase [Moraxella]MBE9579628.1 D-tyrosyl-tRNA(Tyr) deacylase [Moraxella sp. K1664]MBE9589026.1 D-tyrosyl-tRNA(Tyr) deacylase [Moraxella sp. K1630]MBE9597319.1 D-tyrosyl-tRNA(Tyr) deacylase [Moraxella sp. K2450]MDH9219737.1 D-aminoacyl-tRNA deacylase [Moraxella lacunata]MDI4483689.1 D-tyrosyl-tRNA(Tyr) deacylase [Moraxella lacunata]